MSPPFTGTVYGTLLNFRDEYEAWQPRMGQPPYGAPPAEPVLYVKTANTFSAAGAAIALPLDVPEVEIGATIGLVMGAGGAVAGYVLLNDLCVPHDSYFRPPVKHRCRDGFLGIGARRVAPDAAGDLAAMTLQVRVNGALVQTVRFDALVRPADRLLADVAEFMTLGAGDVLMPGCAGGRPRARAGDRIEITSPVLGTLVNTLEATA